MQQRRVGAGAGLSRRRSPSFGGAAARSRRRSNSIITAMTAAGFLFFVLLVYLGHDARSVLVKEVKKDTNTILDEAKSVFRGPGGDSKGDGDTSGLEGMSIEAWVPIGPDPPGCLERSQSQLNITVVYGLGAEDLTLFGYRAMESILHVYPSATVRFATVGPRYATVYKWANVLPPTQFQKYAKRGYNVAVDVMYGAHTSYARERPTGKRVAASSAPLLPGGRFWLRHKNDLLFGGGMELKIFQTTADALPDAFLWLYFSLLRLFLDGGIHTDLSLFLLRPLPADRVGYAVAPLGCGFATTRRRLHRPVLMHYPAPRHKVPECVLKAFDDEKSELNRCVAAVREAPAMSSGDDGLECVLASLQRCHAASNLRNALGDAAPVEWLACDAARVFGPADARARPAAVHAAGMFAPAGMGAGADPASAAAGGADEDLVGLAAARAAARGKDAGAAALEAVVAREDTVTLYLGGAVGDGRWTLPTEGSLAAAAFSRLRLTKWRREQVNPQCRTSPKPCHRFAASAHESDMDLAKAALYCAPTLFVPGAQKGASTFLFHAITWHPQVLQPLRGAHDFKETGRYISNVGRGFDRLGVRMAAFPFIEENENFASSDGTVTYMSADKLVPETIRRDNPYAKAVFALRDPVERAWSDYRFLWEVYKGPGLAFDDVIRSTLPGWKEIFSGHNHNGTWDDFEGIEHTYSRVRPKARDPGDLVRRSLYYYQVRHWVNVFGAENIMVVDSEDLRSRQSETIQAVYRFLGLCPVDVTRLAPENVNKGNKVPQHMKVTEPVWNELKEFYRPFNQKLYDLIGRDLGWEHHKFKRP